MIAPRANESGPRRHALGPAVDPATLSSGPRPTRSLQWWGTDTTATPGSNSRRAFIWRARWLCSPCCHHFGTNSPITTVTRSAPSALIASTSCEQRLARARGRARRPRRAARGASAPATAPRASRHPRAARRCAPPAPGRAAGARRPATLRARPRAGSATGTSATCWRGARVINVESCSTVGRFTTTMPRSKSRPALSRSASLCRSTCRSRASSMVSGTTTAQRWSANSAPLALHERTRRLDQPAAATRRTRACSRTGPRTRRRGCGPRAPRAPPARGRRRGGRCSASPGRGRRRPGTRARPTASRFAVATRERRTRARRASTPRARSAC